jgi:hypothetical protein
MSDEKKKKDLVVREETRPAIAEDVIDDIIEMSDDTAMWGRLTQDGIHFASQDKTVPYIVGPITGLDRYLVMFPGPGQKPVKKPWTKNDAEIPEDFSRRVDVRIYSNQFQQYIGVSLSESSAKFQLSPYLKYLHNQGIRPEEAITKISTRQASNDKGTWSVAIFELVDTTGTPGDENYKEPVVGEEVRAPSDSPNGLPDEWDFA